jgi:hypothetical protein
MFGMAATCLNPTKKRDCWNPQDSERDNTVVGCPLPCAPSYQKADTMLLLWNESETLQKGDIDQLLVGIVLS